MLGLSGVIGAEPGGCAEMVVSGAVVDFLLRSI